MSLKNTRFVFVSEEYKNTRFDKTAIIYYVVHSNFSLRDMFIY